MFGISGTELLIVAVFGFLLFGPDKLPQMGRTLGRALRQFRETQEKLTAVVQTEVVDPMAAAAQNGAKKAGVAPAADDSDADAPVASGEGAPANPVAGPARKETFAERRARLAAEKAEAEAAKAAAAAEATEGEGAGEEPAEDGIEATASAASVEPAVESVAQDVAAPVAEADEPAVRTTEDLYARRPRKRKTAEAESVDAADEPVANDTDSAAVEGGEQ